MNERAGKTRVKAPAPAVQREPAKTPAMTNSSGRAGLLQGAGPALGLGVQRQVADGEPGDRFEREADATADRVSQGQSVEPAAISPVTPENLAQTAPQAAEPAKMAKATVQKAEALPEKMPETMPVQKAERPTDWLGILLIGTTLVSLQIILNRGQIDDWFGSPRIRLLAWIGATALVLWTAPRAIIAVYLDIADAANRGVVAIALQLLAIAALFQVFDGVQTIAAGALRGYRDTAMPMLLAAIGYWGIGFVGSWLLGFPLGYGVVGLWWGLALGLAIVAGLLCIRLARVSRPPTGSVD